MKNLKIILISAIIVILASSLTIFFKNKFSSKGKKAFISACELYSQADALVNEGKLLEAKAVYKTIVNESPDFKEISQVEKKLQGLNMKIIFSSLETPQTTMYEVKSGDSLVKIAERFKTTVEFIKHSNNFSSDVIKAGRRIRIWAGKFSCVVDKSQNILMLKSDDEIIKVYTVSTGANNGTPVGIFKIVNKLVSPPWYKAGAIVSPESPDNILGSRWMGLNIEGYGIHGTTEPQTIGRQITQGCVRMLNNEVEELYSILPVGTEVTIID